MLLLFDSSERFVGGVSHADGIKRIARGAHSGPALAAAATMSGSTGGLLSDCFLRFVAVAVVEGRVEWLPKLDAESGESPVKSESMLRSLALTWWCA